MFQGEFDDLLSTVNVKVDFCPAEAHWLIGAVERRNAVLRTILAKMINDSAATTLEQLDLLITGSLHAMNSFMTAKGRSPFQAVFGRTPQLPGGLFTDGGSLAETVLDPAFKAESVRTEALTYLATMNVDPKVPDLQPAQRCAFGGGENVACGREERGPLDDFSRRAPRQTGMDQDRHRDRDNPGSHGTASGGSWLRGVDTGQGGNRSPQRRGH